ncbi:MAG: aminotransferase class I/II-fold pyridoxal phosphate-dependent enzyme [Maricaulaceae bacterium]|nr:aminotransferase class I/II-fold pyridoxal phosphate-dependent enzyme [Maricaulaceae bacterium]
MNDAAPRPSAGRPLNLNVRGLDVSATLAINERSRALMKEGRKVHRLGLGQSPFPVPEPVRRALSDHAHQKDYLPVRGLPELRAAVCGHLKRTQGLDYDPASILIGPGTKELMFLVQLCYYGDLVIPTPSWVSYAPQAQIIGRSIRWLPTRTETGLGVTPQALDALCRKDPDRPRLLILNSPSNPTGLAYEDGQLAEIAAVARRYGVLVLSDEIYGGVHFEGRHVSIARHYPEGTIISDGLSKWCGAGGWRLGAFAFPPQLKWLSDAMSVVASETYTSVSAPIQHAAVTAFSGGAEIDGYLDRSRRILAALAAFATERLTAAGAAMSAPKGGFYAFPDFSVHRDALAARGVTASEEFCERLLEEAGVATLPGTAFGRPEGEFSLRLAYVDFDGGPALDALSAPGAEADESFLRAHAPDTVAGLERLADWASG